MPALPLDEAGKYVAAAYVVFFTLVIVYVAIIGAKIGRIERELGELADLAERDAGASGGDDSPGAGAPSRGEGTAAEAAGDGPSAAVDEQERVA